MNSTRAEISGVIAPLLTTLKIARYYNLNKGAPTMHVGNKVFYINGHLPATGEGTFKHLTSDYNLKLHKTHLEAELLQKYNITVTYNHIKAHQDTHTLQDAKGNNIPLNHPAELNIYCDKKTERTRTHPI